MRWLNGNVAGALDASSSLDAAAVGEWGQNAVVEGSGFEVTLAASLSSPLPFSMAAAAAAFLGVSVLRSVSLVAVAALLALSRLIFRLVPAEDVLPAPPEPLTFARLAFFART